MWLPRKVKSDGITGVKSDHSFKKCCIINVLFFLLNLFLFIYFYLFICLLTYLWPRWVSVAARGLSLVAVSGSYSSFQCVGFSLRWLLLLWSTGSKRMGFSSSGMRASVVVAHGLSCSAACGNLPWQGLEPMSPALAGRFLTTEPPEKPHQCS